MDVLNIPGKILRYRRICGLIDINTYQRTDVLRVLGLLNNGDSRTTIQHDDYFLIAIPHVQGWRSELDTDHDPT